MAFLLLSAPATPRFPWENDNKNITTQRTEHEYIHILKVLGDLGAEVCRMANFMHWQHPASPVEPVLFFSRSPQAFFRTLLEL